MQEYKISDTTLSAIASAIRGKTLDSSPMYVSEFASNIENIPSADPTEYATLIENTMSEVRSNLVTFIPPSRFMNCSSLDTVYLPEVSVVKAYGFYRCGSTRFYLPKLESVFTYAFRNTTIVPYESTYSLFQNVISLSDSAFYYTTFPDEVTFPKLTFIPSYAFYGAVGNTVYFPSVTSTSKNAFASTSIQKIYLPQLSYVNSYAFASAEGLKEVYISSVTNIWGSGFLCSPYLEKVEAPNLISISGSAFQSCGIYSANFPKLTSMNIGAFLGCYRLSEFSASSCTALPSYAFNNCSKLKKVTLSDQVTFISDSAFASCSILETLDFKLSAGNSIYAYAFFKCYKLSDISMLESAEKLGGSAFAFCSAITSIYFPKIEYAPYCGFANCINLSVASFVTPMRFNSACFSNCANLKSIYISGSEMASLSLAPSYVFYGTPFLNSTVSDAFIYVPSSLLTTYQTTTNWIGLSSRFSAYEFPEEVTNE